MSAKKVGIFSGTFDPIHNGHLWFASAAIKKCNLDKVFFLVEPRPRRKQGVKAFEHRLAMVQLAIKRRSKMGAIILSQQRFSAEHTLPILEARFKGAELHLLMGDDMLNHLVGWPSVNRLIDSVKFIIGVRGDKSKAEDKIKHIAESKNLEFKYSIFNSSLSDASSSRVKAAIRSNQPSGSPNSVLRYIRNNGLYSSDANSDSKYDLK